MTFSAVRQKLSAVLNGHVFVPLFLLLISILAYGLMIPWLHLYIDDWIWHWTWERMGSAGLVKYFAPFRPIWGLLFQVTFPFLYPSIPGYHLFALLVRWASALASWWLFRLLWPDRVQTAFWGALLFLLYPGFALQPIAITYSHLFLVYVFFLLSLCFNLLSLKNRKRYWIYTIIALVLSMANLLMVEFYFTLELARFFIIFIVTRRVVSGRTQQIRQTFTHWMPYLLVFIGSAIYRAFFFSSQTDRYQFKMIDQVKADPIQTAAGLTAQIFKDIPTVSLWAWWPAVNRIIHLEWWHSIGLITLLVVFSVAVLVWVVILLRHSKQPFREKTWALETMALGLITMLVAGWPFWLTGLSIQLLDFKSRFTMPFILGTTILLLGLIEWIGPRWLQAGILALALGIASGYHFQIANDFRMD